MRCQPSIKLKLKRTAGHKIIVTNNLLLFYEIRTSYIIALIWQTYTLSSINYKLFFPINDY